VTDYEKAMLAIANAQLGILYSMAVKVAPEETQSDMANLMQETMTTVQELTGIKPKP